MRQFMSWRKDIIALPNLLSGERKKKFVDDYACEGKLSHFESIFFAFCICFRDLGSTKLGMQSFAYIYCVCSRKN